jgi:hypothetical protein
MVVLMPFFPWHVLLAAYDHVHFCGSDSRSHHAGDLHADIDRECANRFLEQRRGHASVDQRT